MNQFSIQTRASGYLDVTIEDIGEFRVILENMPLNFYAGQAYTVLTGKALRDRGDFFQLISYDPGNRKVLFRINK